VKARAEADQFAENVLPIVRQIQASGATSLRQIAAALTARGVPTARGGTWNAMTLASYVLFERSLTDLLQSWGNVRSMFVSGMRQWPKMN
jgi:hypothetical protein